MREMHFAEVSIGIEYLAKNHCALTYTNFLRMNILKYGLPAFLALALPLTASAHQHAVYEIGGETYEFTIGSLGEPIAVDDRTGVDFRVSKPGHASAPDADHHEAGSAVSGLENSLKVELIAGDKKKVLELDPVYNTPGSYSAKFYPTVATTLQYRIFGTIEDTPIDLTFTCRAEGADAADEGAKEVSQGVRQISKSGGFGCPAEKSSLGFPEASAAIAEVAQESGSSRGIAVAGLALAVIALVLAGAANRRRV